MVLGRLPGFCFPLGPAVGAAARGPLVRLRQALGVVLAGDRALLCTAVGLAVRADPVGTDGQSGSPVLGVPPSLHRVPSGQGACREHGQADIGSGPVVPGGVSGTSAARRHRRCRSSWSGRPASAPSADGAASVSGVLNPPPPARRRRRDGRGRCRSRQPGSARVVAGTAAPAPARRRRGRGGRGGGGAVEGALVKAVRGTWGWGPKRVGTAYLRQGRRGEGGAGASASPAGTGREHAQNPSQERVDNAHCHQLLFSWWPRPGAVPGRRGLAYFEDTRIRAFAVARLREDAYVRSMDLDRGKPVWPQIADELRRRIDVGTYAPGSRFPAVVDLAAEFDVAASTVQKAVASSARRAGSVPCWGRARSSPTRRSDPVLLDLCQPSASIAFRIRARAVGPYTAMPRSCSKAFR